MRETLAADIDRRFEDGRRETDERLTATIHMRVALQDELDRRFSDIKTLQDERLGNSVETARFSRRRSTAGSRTWRPPAIGAHHQERSGSENGSRNKRHLDSVNEFRKQLGDQTASFITRNEYTLAHQNLTDGVIQLREDITRLGGTVVPRTENESWRKQISDKLDDNTRTLTERLGALELRLTSRLDLGTGRDTGTLAGRDQQRLNVAQIIAVVAVAATIVTAILLALKK